ncbi:hypothetical protein [Campylobacter sp. RM16192]|uniref:hypothetical protein n=1 Tax=Campylobacter sp. RM16192 TaxID=1660080 RepID=UPI001451D7AD|nr:hypothetical protein [Campylobacter sp. RM16192]QCD52512.1 hypothetical protein CDOMC_0889 [Campylobacter sp. RM16192]
MNLLSTLLKFVAGNKMWIIIISALVGVAIGLFILVKTQDSRIDSLIKETARLQAEIKSEKTKHEISKADLQTCKSKIDLQNAEIKQISIDNERLKNIQPEIKKEVETKYRTIKVPAKDSKCEAKLVYYENLFKELGR